MAGLLRLTREETYNVARKIFKANHELAEIYTKLHSIMSNLQLDWEGVESQSFYKKYEQWNLNMQGYIGLLERIGQEINHIADKDSGDL